jgi:LDH2 family malate/lactate/ureidoglycolate dehydrogenase
MKITIEEAEELVRSALDKAGYSDEEIYYCIQNVLDGELMNKKSHGFIRIIKLIEYATSNKVIYG